VNSKWLATGLTLVLTTAACSGDDPVSNAPAGGDSDDDSSRPDESSVTEEEATASDASADASPVARNDGGKKPSTPIDAGSGQKPAPRSDAKSEGPESDAATKPEPTEDASEPSNEACAENEQQNPQSADPCTAPLRPGEDRKCEFMFNGMKRKFYIYAPPTYNACKPAAMVVDCHGATESAEVHIGQAKFSPENPLGYGSSWRRAIQGDNAIVVTPEGVGLRWSKAEDPAYLNKVADMVEAVAKVDPEKRYLTGISMGGMITAETTCKDTKRWRGMVPVAMLTNTCPSITQPTPALILHSETDSITSYADSRKLAEKMVQLNKCQGAPTKKSFGGPNSAEDKVCFEMPYGPGSPDAKDPYAVSITACPKERPESVCELWSQCDEGAQVMFCTVEAAKQKYGGHLLYTNDTGLHLAALAWPFLKQFWK
jgi:hypothetical protein